MREWSCSPMTAFEALNTLVRQIPWLDDLINMPIGQTTTLRCQCNQCPECAYWKLYMVLHGFDYVKDQLRALHGELKDADIR